MTVDVETIWSAYAAGAAEASGSIDLTTYFACSLEVQVSAATNLDLEGSADDATFRWHTTEPFTVETGYVRFIEVERMPKYLRVVTSAGVTITVIAHKVKVA